MAELRVDSVAIAAVPDILVTKLAFAGYEAYNAHSEVMVGIDRLVVRPTRTRANRLSQPAKEKALMFQQLVKMSLAGIAMLAVASLSGVAQSPLPAPPQIPYGMSVSTDNAKKAAAASIAEARKNKWNMAIAVVDTGGYLVYFEKMQDTQTGSVDLAIEKARTSALFRRPTKVFQDAVAAGGDGLRVLRLTGAIPNEGGVPIIVEGKVIGAIGVSGGSVEQDGQVAKAGAGALK